MLRRIVTKRVLSRFLSAMEHSSPEELKDYLKDHPNADPRNHTVEKGDGGGGGSKSEERVSMGQARSIADALDKAIGAGSKPMSEDKFYHHLKSLDRMADNLEKEVDKALEKAGDKMDKKDLSQLSNHLKSLRGDVEKAGGLLPDRPRRHQNVRQDKAQDSMEKVKESFDAAMKLVNKYAK